MAVSKEMTPWFSATKHKPGRIGVYEIKTSYRAFSHYAYWNGRLWMATSRSVKGAKQSTWESFVMNECNAEWKGFTNEQ